MKFILLAAILLGLSVTATAQTELEAHVKAAGLKNLGYSGPSVGGKFSFLHTEGRFDSGAEFEIASAPKKATLDGTYRAFRSGGRYRLGKFSLGLRIQTATQTTSEWSKTGWGLAPEFGYHPRKDLEFAIFYQTDDNTFNHATAIGARAKVKAGLSKRFYVPAELTFHRSRFVVPPSDKKLTGYKLSFSAGIGFRF
jgi:hypothetical protein